jgi:hypothetical protein
LFRGKADVYLKQKQVRSLPKTSGVGGGEEEEEEEEAVTPAPKF